MKTFGRVGKDINGRNVSDLHSQIVDDNIQETKTLIGLIMRSARVRKGMTLTGLAKRTGISQYTLSRLENGKFDSVNVLFRLMMQLGVFADFQMKTNDDDD